MARQLVIRDDFEINLILRVRQMELAGAPGAHVDFIHHTITADPTEHAAEYLDPTRPKVRASVESPARPAAASLTPG